MNNNHAEDLENVPNYSMFELVKLYENDQSQDKLNLILGVCIDDNKKVYKFDIVQQVSQNMVNGGNLSHGYTTIPGLPGLAPFANNLIFGEESQALKDNKVVSFQTCGATGALSMGGNLLIKYFKRGTIYIPIQTWEQHLGIFGYAGFEIKRYRYYDPDQQKVDFDGLMEDLQQADDNSVILLHATCHNPTGGVLTRDQWAEIMSLMQERKLFPFFDIAYQGLGKDLETDCLAIRMFADSGIEFLTAQTFSKNFGLYGERVGFLFAVLNDPTVQKEVSSQLEYYAGNTYLMTAAFGAKLVYNILSDAELKERWMAELNAYNVRMSKIRNLVKAQLEQKVKGKDFSFVVDNEGLFAWFNFKGNEAAILRSKYHVYVLANGRVNMSGLGLKDVDYFTDAMAAVL